MRFKMIMTLVLQSLGLALSNEFFPQWKYDNWASELKPGFIIEQRSSCPRCYCKVPVQLNTTTSTTSTSTTTSTTTTSTPTTTTTTSTPTTTSTTSSTSSTSTTTSTTPTTTITTTTTTPTTTSTTSSTSSTSTTTSTTTTSTASTSTTTGTTTTTDKNVYWSGNCSVSVTMSHGTSVYWQSPLYDGGTTNYPEGDYCCSCNITIPASYYMFIVTMEMSDPSSIHETSNCKGDQITYYSSSGLKSKLCGDLAQQTWTETQIFNGPNHFSYTWCSDPTDGGTDIGFKLSITGHDLYGGK